MRFWSSDRKIARDSGSGADLQLPPKWDFTIDDRVEVAEQELVLSHHHIPESLYANLTRTEIGSLVTVLQYTEHSSSSPTLVDYYISLIRDAVSSPTDDQLGSALHRLVSPDHCQLERVGLRLDEIEGVTTDRQFLLNGVMDMSTHQNSVTLQYLDQLYQRFALAGYLARLEMLHFEILSEGTTEMFDTNKMSPYDLEQILRYKGTPPDLYEAWAQKVGAK